MGLSGMKGKVYYIDDSCPAAINSCTAFGTEASGTAVCWADEVTKFTLVDSVQKREYGHDKSQGWQDVVAGTRRLGITLDAVIASAVAASDATPPPLRAGRVLWLQLYPMGSTCTDPIEGYAMIDQISYTYDQERGDPIGYTMTLSSKGPWVGFADTGEWGGFECECSASA